MSVTVSMAEYFCSTLCMVDLCISYFSDPKIVVSGSSGCLTLVELTDTGLIPSSQWKAHDFEAWIAAFNYFSTNIIYSGKVNFLLLFLAFVMMGEGRFPLLPLKKSFPSHIGPFPIALSQTPAYIARPRIRG